MGRTLKTERPHGREPALAQGKTTAGYRVAGRIWLEKDGETYLAWGRIVLLERIRSDGSIIAAAKSMGMGYRHAWKLVEDMNRLAPTPLVSRATGGKGGGGTALTPAGEEAIRHFWELVGRFSRFLETVPPMTSAGGRARRTKSR